ncbi:hypothetical protein N7454_004489 [Penicillium verhagenii]|nr:hypothetical protein N7454_004489 [Penicillium verhagenii]
MPSALPIRSRPHKPSIPRHLPKCSDDPNLPSVVLLSDSSLSDVPIGLEPENSYDEEGIFVIPPTPVKNREFVAAESATIPESLVTQTRSQDAAIEVTQSFPIFSEATAGSTVLSSFPPLSTQSFGLVQEQLAHDPFKLLIATIFLNRTRGGVALPVLFKVFERYPTLESMAVADESDLVAMINCLGFQNQRARKCILLAQTWLNNPPVKNKRYRRLHYPHKLDGRDIARDECVDDEDPRSAWEVAHFAGVGAYSLDSWRIFCRDKLRGVATDWLGTGASSDGFVPEWKSVLPKDKELRAYLTWLWLKEGWVWDHHTGDLSAASEKMLRAARAGGVAHEEDGNWTLETSPVKVRNGFHED